MEASEIKRVTDPADPTRCQSVAKGEQCMMQAVPGGTFCMLHGGNKQLEAQERLKVRNYRLTKWHATVDRFTDNANIKSLREEIAILRMMLEERLNTCADTSDLLLHSGPIAFMITNIEKLVSSCHKLEGSMGQLLDKAAILQFAGTVITIITDVLDDEKKISEIADRIIGTIKEDK